MTSETHEAISNRSVVVAVTHDNARVWLLNEDSSAPVHVIERVESEHMHVRSAQVHHGHATENGEVAFFAEIADVIRDASSIILLGHGTGKANAAERFSHYLRDHAKPVAIKVMAVEVVNLPALGNAEILSEAHRRWKILTSRS